MDTAPPAKTTVDNNRENPKALFLVPFALLLLFAFFFFFFFFARKFCLGASSLHRIPRLPEAALPAQPRIPEPWARKKKCRRPMSRKPRKLLSCCFDLGSNTKLELKKVLQPPITETNFKPDQLWTNAATAFHHPPAERLTSPADCLLRAMYSEMVRVISYGKSCTIFWALCYEWHKVSGYV